MAIYSSQKKISNRKTNKYLKVHIFLLYTIEMYDFYSVFMVKKKKKKRKKIFFQ